MSEQKDKWIEFLENKLDSVEADLDDFMENNPNMIQSEDSLFLEALKEIDRQAYERYINPTPTVQKASDILRYKMFFNKGASKSDKHSEDRINYLQELADRYRIVILNMFGLDGTHSLIPLAPDLLLLDGKKIKLMKGQG